MLDKDKTPVIVHLIYRLDIGGLERVMLNCINQMQGEKFQHVIISLTDANNFVQAKHNHIEVFCLGKKQGSDLGIHFKLFKLLRKIKPAILHTYNLPTIEYHPISWLAGVKGHIHAEHGRDLGDPQGLNKKHNFLRKLMSGFIQRYVSVSEDLHQWLISTVGISQRKALLIQNGINTDRFNLPKTLNKENTKQLRFAIVARITPVKDHQNLLSAFVLLQEQIGSAKMPQLAIVGDGEQREQLTEFCQAKALNTVEFLGSRDDIAQILANTDVFVLSSIAEGIPMTILEAMSAKTAVVSTRVGGVPEVITDGQEGFLVEKSNPIALAKTLLHYIEHPELIAKHGEQARKKILEKFNEKKMVQAYLEQYQALVKGQI
ncbi:TIGR03088 family PEP-CTERM/XrtA system glycosyltransferase [Colwellia piezophila]|uniref:TIGR03088 family PEP-CTERM/XrtA system glycosyltransferase n=1 Tax=Colwellia piezophila TaxID=211668 RepID=UPI000368AE8D|nr:TIGR03088 family PEP-CTERM/XrtA system glycosyltransferase [Colwellia piezophila]